MTPEWFTFTSVGENAFMIFNDKNDKDNIKPFHDVPVFYIHLNIEEDNYR